MFMQATMLSNPFLNLHMVFKQESSLRTLQSHTMAYFQTHTISNHCPLMQIHRKLAIPDGTKPQV